MESNDKRDRAQLRLQAIDDLKKCVPFIGYFIPRLKAKQEALAARVLNDDTINPDEREHLRRIWQEYEKEILRMVETDAGVAQGTLRGP